MEQPVNPNRNVFAVKNFLKEYLDLRKDKDNELATVDSIRKGVEFKGANLWILIFAIFMASLGLNVNSTAVIIGAMLTLSTGSSLSSRRTQPPPPSAESTL